MVVPALFAATGSLAWLNTFGLLVGLAFTLGGIAAAFWASRSKGIIELLKTENAAYKDSNARLHDENTELKQTNATCTAELKVWQNNVTQAPNIDKLITTIGKQHNEYMQELGSITASIVALTKGLADNAKEAKNGK